MWHSYHLHFPDKFGAVADEFLANELSNLVHEEQEAGRLRRFFFLRYSHGGPHLRLRFQPTDGQDPRSPSLRTVLDSHAQSLGGRLEEQPYDRGRQYFGESFESVYAEALNVATSRLALALLRFYDADRRVHRWLAVTCLCGQLLDSSCDGSPEEAIEQCRDFARRVALEHGFDPAEPAPDLGQRRISAVLTAWPQVAAGVPRSLLEPVAALLRRVQNRGETGRHVAIHALHLLCNKTGFLIQEEYEIFALLQVAQPQIKEMSK
ncbi:MAG: thiopeptide-type bacteriocin biosynthesis protein [Acidobacteriota bacterium]